MDPAEPPPRDAVGLLRGGLSRAKAPSARAYWVFSRSCLKERNTEMTADPEFFDFVPVTEQNPRSGEGDMVVLQDGRLFFAYTSFEQERDDARASIVGRCSSDGGRTWTEPETLITNEAAQNVMSVSLLRLQSGGLLLFYMRKDGPSRASAWVRRSDDETETWSEAICCTPDPIYHVIVNDCALQLSDGRIILPYEACEEVWVADEHIVAGTAYSDDEGATWQQSNTIYSPKRGAMEAKVVELREGRLWMLLRTDRGVLDESCSEDRGETWSHPVSSGIESPQSPFVFTRVPSTGDLLLIRNPVANLEQGTHQGHRTPLTSAISKDEGRTWVNPKDLEPDTSRTYCYVSTTFMDDIAVLSYYVGRLDQPLECLRIARVPVAWFYE